VPFCKSGLGFGFWVLGFGFWVLGLGLGLNFNAAAARLANDLSCECADLLPHTRRLYVTQSRKVESNLLYRNAFVISMGYFR
jgi:hypothetical protein